jgi:hypothetical protein
LQNAERLDSEIIYNRDFDYDYFGFKVGSAAMCAPDPPGRCALGLKANGGVAALQTLERSYLLRINSRVVERPQHMLMRVAVGIHKQVWLYGAGTLQA